MKLNLYRLLAASAIVMLSLGRAHAAPPTPEGDPSYNPPAHFARSKFCKEWPGTGELEDTAPPRIIQNESGQEILIVAVHDNTSGQITLWPQDTPPGEVAGMGELSTFSGCDMSMIKDLTRIRFPEAEIFVVKKEGFEIVH